MKAKTSTIIVNLLGFTIGILAGVALLLALNGCDVGASSTELDAPDVLVAPDAGPDAFDESNLPTCPSLGCEAAYCSGDCDSGGFACPCGCVCRGQPCRFEPSPNTPPGECYGAP